MSIENKNKVLVISFLMVLSYCALVSSAAVNSIEKTEINENEDRSIEQGRTMVHHAMKRLAILLPPFMFKLGIMFTMLLVTMITSANGLLVGTLLLALGAGHFIANKFSSTSAPTHAHISLPHPHIHAAWHSAPHFVDRSDSVSSPSISSGYAQQQQASSAQMVGTIPAGYAQQQAYSAWKQ